MTLVKYLLIGAGLLVVLFVGSAFVAALVEVTGIIEPSDERGRGQTPGDEENARRGGRTQDRASIGGGYPLLLVTRVIDGDTVDTDKFTEEGYARER